MLSAFIVPCGIHLSGAFKLVFWCVIHKLTAYLFEVIVARLVCSVMIFFSAVKLRRLVDVVQATKEYTSCPVGEAQAKGLELIAPVAFVGCSATSLDVGRSSNVILALEDDVHCIFLLVLVVDAQELVLLGLLLIHLDVLHREVGQVFEHNLVLAFEEVGTV